MSWSLLSEGIDGGIIYVGEKYTTTCMSSISLPGVELRFSRHSPDWRVTQNFYSPNQRKTRQNHVFAEHLYTVHFICTSPTRKIDHHDCVCVIIINKSLCQVCVCISESGRNKTQLAGGKKTHWEEEKTLASLASKWKKLLANFKFHSHLASWRVVISTPEFTVKPA
jgi:hypothetical protein